MSDLIDRQAAIAIIRSLYPSMPIMPKNREWWEEKYEPFIETEKALKLLPSAQPETCEGCKHLGKWENEVEYGYSSPCTCCKRRVKDNYER